MNDQQRHDRAMKGGNALSKKYDHQHFVNIGKIGGTRNYQKNGSLHMIKIATLGGIAKNRMNVNERKNF